MKKLLGFILFLSPLFLQAQQINVDSLINVLETKTLTAKELLDHYNEICKGLSFTDTDKTAMYARKGLALAEKEKDPLMLSYFNEYLGISYNLKDRPDSSAMYLEKALDWKIPLVSAKILFRNLA